MVHNTLLLKNLGGANLILSLLFFMLSFDIVGQADITGLRYEAINEVSKPIGVSATTFNQDLNNILKNYSIQSIQQAFPEAKTQAVQNIYRIVLNTIDQNKYLDLYNSLNQLSLIKEIIIDRPELSLSSMACDPEEFNDPLLQGADAWYLDGMNIPCAWEVTHGDPNITVAVVDLFFDNGHDDLAGKFVSINNCNPLFYPCGHGFASAGAVAAIVNNSKCTVGSGYDTKVAGYCVASGCDSGSPGSGAWQAYLDGHKIINISFAGVGVSLSQVKEMVGNGVVITTGAYGSNNGPISEIEGVIHVGQADANRHHVDYEGFTPGVDIYALCWSVNRLESYNSCGWGWGLTSFGAPTVAGIVALMKSVNPCLSPADIEFILKETNGGLPANAGSYGITAGIMDAHAAVVMAQSYDGTDVTINTPTTTYDGVRMISGDLIVESGSTLTITGTVKFGQNSRLVVKRGARLVIDGGELTNYCGTHWRGISLEGNTSVGQAVSAYILPTATQAGTVLMINGAEISGANTAISMLNDDYSWPLYAEYWGGLVHAENSFFTNNKRALAFMQNPATDRSKFKNCTFSGHDQAATIWAANGIEFNNCTFNDFNLIGVLAWDAWVNILDCPSFDGITESKSISLVQTIPLLDGSSITGNTFNDGTFGVHSIASYNQSRTVVNNNDFYGTEYGVNFEGLSEFKIEKNSYSGCDIGSIQLGTGDADNLVSQNQYNGNGVGNYVIGSNFGTSILENCFTQSAYDIAVFVPAWSTGGIHPFQQVSQTIEAGNCFSKGGVPSFIRPAFGAPGSTWVEPTYFIKQNTSPASCKYPSSSLITRSLTSTESSEYCENLPPGIPPQRDFCQFPAVMTKPQIFTEMTNLESQISTLKSQLNSAKINDPYNFILIASLESKILIKTHCLRKLKTKYIIVLKDNNELASKRSDFATETDFITKVIYIGALITERLYSDATLFVNQMSPITQEEIDFVSVQVINLNRLAAGPGFLLSSGDESTLINIGSKYDPLSGFARGLYTGLTGEYIEMDYPAIGSATLPRSIEESNFVELVSVHPNPVHDVLNVDVKSPHGKCEIIITNLSGNVVINKVLVKDDNNKSIDISTYPIGLYFIKIVDEGKEIFLNKFIKI